ncbi:MAG: UvrD-helicase domain-containing protein [Clostridiales Family XIII bacterium]|jgi:DNA helicase-2/ATP-dependent DNA helicase PcrA|nr:UvrD-helicase domain-containing protein [Clostridiales Family XIII bacterium]
MNYLNKLNPKQREAAVHKDGPLLILAGAGSGKTSTMTHRIAWLIKDEHVPPYNILAVTFTNKAAAEMRERVEALIGPAPRMWILTFHSACLRMLRRDAGLLGYEGGFAVYDPTDQKTVMKNCIKEQRVDDKKFTPAYVLAVISDCKEKGMDAKGYAADSEGSYTAQVVAPLFHAYEKALKKNNAMDFDDLILNAVRLLETAPEILAHYQDRFKYIMVDEYQDTNSMQYRFISLLAKERGNICVVGDDDQCIYQWRGADINNILDFEKDFRNAKVVKLEQNYRSYGNILNCAHSVIENNKSRKGKKLWTDKGSGEKITYRCWEDEKQEAAFVAHEITRLCEQGMAYKDFAVLYRANAQSRTFEEALSAGSVPYRVLGGLRYYDRKEIKDVLAYMRLVQNPADDLAFIRAVNEPKRGVGGKTLEKLASLAEERGEGLLALASDGDALGALPAKAAAEVGRMAALIRELSAEKDNLRVSDIYERLLTGTGYLRSLEAQESVEAEGRIENLLEFISVIKSYEKDEPDISIAEFMERIALISDIDNHDSDEDAVALMTLHSAKGLEFPVVFMPGMEDGLFPGWRSLEKQGGIEEERRLCYVGMTRAKEKLYLTRARQRTLYGKTDYTMESSFLRELDKSYLDGDNIRGNSGPLFHKPRTGNDGYAEKETARPFNQLKYAKESVERQAAAGDGLKLKNGDKLFHGKFGEGLVLEADEKTVTVVFGAAGVKKLSRNLAPVTILSED